MYEEEYYDQMGDGQGQQGMAGDPYGQQQPMEPYYDPYQIEQIRQEVELAHEEFMRLMDGRPRLYSRF